MKQRMRRISALLLVVLMCVSMVMPAFAAEEGANCPGVGQIHKKSNCSYGEAIAVHEAGCGEQGYTVYQCTECETYFADDFVESFGDHEWMYLVKDATCLDKGYYKKVCMNCDVVDASYEEPALGHAWNDSDCKNVVCDRCGETATAEDDIHNWGKPELVTAPKYTTGRDGNVTVKPGKAKLVCEDCGIEKEVPIEVAGVIQHTVHEWGEDQAEKPATCQKAGTTAGKKCTICGATAKITGQTTDPFVTIPVVPCDPSDEMVVVFPSCTEAGSAHYECTMCKTVMGTPIALEVVGHGYQQKVYTEAAGGKTLKQIFDEYKISTGLDAMTLYVDGNKMVIDANVTGTETYAWTGEFVEEGEYAYGKDCSEYSYIHYNCYICHTTVTVTLEPGHVWVLDEAASAEAVCGTGGQTVWYCSNPNCKGKLATDGVDVTTDATTGRAVKTTVLAPLNHEYVPVVTAPTCEEPGYTEDLCKYCGAADPEGEEYNYTDPDTVNGHVAVEVIVTAPSCTVVGQSKVVCEVCDKVLSEVYTTPATGHTPDRSVVVSESAATCTEPAIKKYNCTTCGEVVEEHFAGAKGHSYTKVTIVAPNCATGADGYTLMYCNNGCGAYYGEPTNILIFDRNNAAHHGNALLETNRVVGDCHTADVVTYTCFACNYSFSVEDNSVNGKGHSLSTVKAVSATCVSEGNVIYKKCSACDFITVDGSTLATAEDIVIPALSATKTHGETTTVEAVAPSCGVAGNTAGEQCNVCGLMVVESQNLAALQHNYKLISDQVYQYNVGTAGCLTWGYEFHQCTNCGDELILKYEESFGGHTEESYDQVDPTCYAPGTTAGKKCSVCLENLEGGEEIPKVPHTNYDGEEFFTFTDANGEEFATCVETVEPLTCQHCFMSFEKACEWVVTLVPATCNEYSYELWVCKHCQQEEMKNEGFDFSENHVGWGEWVIEKEASIVADGLKVRKCSGCDMTEEVVIPALCGLDFILEAENAVYEGAKITNSGLVALTIKTSTKDLPVWGIRMTLSYDNTVLTSVEYEVANEKFADVQVNFNDNDGVATIVAYASGEKKQDVTLEGEEALVVLYFRVDANEEVGTDMEFATGAIEVLDTAKNEILLPANAATATATVEATLGYVNNDNVINLSDAHAMMEIIASEGYVSAADIDLDGEVTVVDFGLMQDRLLGKLSDNDLALAYITAE